MDLSVLLTLLGGGSITGVIGWFLHGKHLKNQELKKGYIEIQKADVDLAKDTREHFLSIVGDLKIDRDAFRDELKISKDDAKSEREYYRVKIDAMQELFNGLQTKFDSISLNYALEVEKSDKWMQKYFEIEKENKQLKIDINLLENKCQDLEKLYAKLKTDFENHKKLTK
jgi:hypothetical protein